MKQLSPNFPYGRHTCEAPNVFKHCNGRAPFIRYFAANCKWPLIRENDKDTSMFKTLRAARFLVAGPLILGLLAVINLITSPGEWWVKWPALGIGIAWVLSLFRVIRGLIVLGGLAALLAYLRKK